jgi:predicted lipid-binding transport protein (Tim44 family)
MNVLWKGGLLRGGMAQWVLFGAVAAVAGLVIVVLAALGLVVAALLIGIISAAAAPASRRRGRVSAYAVRAASDGREPRGDCVELGRDAYTVRIVDEKTPPA